MADAAKPVTVQYFYRVRWGFQKEFVELFERNHWPLLRAQRESGRLLDVHAYEPRFHGDGRQDWTPDLRLLKSGPLGGDQQLGALIAEKQIDLVVFFWDPLEPHPHDVDVKALLRIAVVYNVPIACNRATADYLISSPLLRADYQPQAPNFSQYIQRDLPTSEKSASAALKVE